MNNVTVSFQPVKIHSLVFVRNYFCNFFMIYLMKPPGNMLHTAKGNSRTNYSYCDYFFKSSKSKFSTTYVIRLQLSRRSSTPNGTKYQSFTPRTPRSYRCDKDRGRWSGNNVCVEPRIKLIFTKNIESPHLRYAHFSWDFAWDSPRLSFHNCNYDVCLLKSCCSYSP
jgi:hypothetical protein